jgi:phosphoglycolate phosphatase-like HAD superfamily hydrolase
MQKYTKQDLFALKAEHSTFVGIDSDGCVFDTMEIKQKKCFHPQIIRHWHLESIEPLVRETAEFVNLYSKTRGKNRFPCIVMTFDNLRKRSEVISANVKIPELKSLRKFIQSGMPLGNPTLEAEVAKTGDKELASVLEWSKAVNRDIEKIVKNVPPFKWVKESLTKIKENSDAICVSQTPEEALVREWNEHNISQYVKVIAGQELGKKAEHLIMATKNKHNHERILMIGDSLGDKKAADIAEGHFYPINPSKESESWERFYNEAYNKFLEGTYAGEYEKKVIKEFDELLPETPTWEQ